MEAAMTSPRRRIRERTAREALDIHLAHAQAIMRCESTVVRAHLEAAREQCQRLPPTPIVECPVCGAAGLPERIADHGCPVETHND